MVRLTEKGFWRRCRDKMLERKELERIGEKFGTPTYIFDMEELLERTERIREILGTKIKLCYAIKANPFIVRQINGLVDRFEVCSPGEYSICKEQKINRGKVVLSGVYKNEKEMEKAKEDEFGGIYTIESLEQINILNKLYKGTGLRPEIMVRLTSGNQFGMDKETIRLLVQSEEYMKNFRLIGIHYFSGTQKKNMNIMEKDIINLIEFCDELKNTFNVPIEEIEYGPGLYIEYFEEKADDLAQLKKLKEIIKQYEAKYRFTIELGRYIAATCGSYLTRVVDLKRNEGINYCIVDGGSHQITYFGQLAGIKNPPVRTVKEDIEAEVYTICGALCSVHDVLAKKIKLSKLQVGSILCLEKCGAYSFMEGCAFFLSRDIPKVLIKTKEAIICVRDTQDIYYYNMESENAG